MESRRNPSPEPDRVIDLPQPLPSPFIANSVTTCKYNALTFIPKSLYYQFQKLANVYFLSIAVLQVIPQISVSNGVPSILLPLAFVLAISLIKEYFEDLNRRKSDEEENNRSILIWADNNWQEKKWKDILVGDILKVNKNEYFPADLILLSSCESNGLCYIETKNLDGETNLKHKLSNRLIHDRVSVHQDLTSICEQVVCEAPNPMIYEFKGKIKIENNTVSMGTEQFLLRGSSLKNTEWIIAMTVYTGHETKIMLNSSKSKNKFSLLETRMNREILNIFFLQLIICFFCATIYVIWFSRTKDDTDVYLELDETTNNNFVMFILNFFTWMLIFTNFVPISLIVTLDVVKYIQAIYIGWDLKLYYEPTDTPARAQSSNLNEELGQINYIFSDKTGTLTCNIMEFRKFSINGVSYGTNKRQDPSTKKQNVDFVDPNFSELDPRNAEFLIHLAVCHTVVTEVNENGITEYKASSPDELALVSAAKMFGVELVGRDDNQGTILNVNGNSEVYQVLNIVEFSSIRKRMSVIVKYPDGRIFVMCKGADNVLLTRLKRTRNIEKSWEHLESYASEGLRTLVLGIKEMSEEEYQDWKEEFDSAMEDIQNREKKLEVVYEKLEKDLELTGITAIEDKLQDQVPATIAFIQEAGIKIWLLTGDKIETAINIGYSSALLTNEMSRAVIDATSEYNIRFQLQEALQVSRYSSSKFSLIVSGDSLLKILKNEHVYVFIKIVEKADAVLACRVSPQQKAELVKLIRDIKPEARTLSIGDGANDVNMILAAHVGVGIAGLEGNQAVRASDYSIAQFSYLKRLLFVHGRECYRRNANLICYNFYKNVLLTMPLFFYGALSAFSGQILYNLWTYQLFNVLYASVPIQIYAIFDKDKRFYNLEQRPEFYQLGLKGKLFSPRTFWLWILEGTLHGLFLTVAVSFALGYYAAEDDGKTASMWELSDLMYSCIVIIANVRIFFFSYTCYWFSVLFIVLSIANYYVTSLMITEWFDIKNFFDNYDGRGSTSKLYSMPITYFILFFVNIAIFLPTPMIKYVGKLKKYLTPLPKYYEVPNTENYDQDMSEEELPLSTYTPLLARKHTGFAFSGEPGHTPQITDPKFNTKA